MPSSRLVCRFTLDCCCWACLGASNWFFEAWWNGCGVVACAEWLYWRLQFKNIYISSGEASSLLLFMKFCWMLMGRFTKRKAWMNFAAISWKACSALTFRCFRKSAKVPTVGVNFAWSHLYLATSFRSSFMNCFPNLSNTSVNVVYVDIVGNLKNSIASSRNKLWKHWSIASSENRLLNGLRWLRRKWSNSLNRSLFPLNVATCVSGSLWFLFVFSSLLGSVVIDDALVLFCHVRCLRVFCPSVIVGKHCFVVIVHVCVLWCRWSSMWGSGCSCQHVGRLSLHW